MAALKRLGKVMPLGGQPWRGIGPFVYANHHVDLYPAGNKHMGPDPALLKDRKLGNDFNNASGTGWNMYMATGPVPGFPAHPHRGFETVSIVSCMFSLRSWWFEAADGRGGCGRWFGGCLAGHPFATNIPPQTFLTTSFINCYW